MSGKLYLVGTGPGDPELLTLKAVRILKSAPFIAYPAKEGEPSLSFRIAREHLNEKAEHLPLEMIMSTERDPAKKAYDGFAKLLAKKLKHGDVAYLCEGDPFFYGSAMYLAERLADHSEVITIPGVSSLTATAAAAGKPIAARNDVLKILPAPLNDARLEAELQTAESVAIIKVGRHFDRIRALLERTGHADDAVIVEHATHPNQRVTPLNAFSHEVRPYFSTILCYRGSENWN